MHEVGLLEEVIAAAEARAGDRKVARVVLEVGKLSSYLPDAVRFAFEHCSEGTTLEGAALEIVETPGLARCRACGGEVPLSGPLGQCACGGIDLEWLAGEDVRVRAIEFA